MGQTLAAVLLGFWVASTAFARPYQLDPTREDPLIITRKFASGGIHVRFVRPVRGEVFTLEIPQTLTSDQMMQALIATRIARDEGAIIQFGFSTRWNEIRLSDAPQLEADWYRYFDVAASRKPGYTPGPVVRWPLDGRSLVYGDLTLAPALARELQIPLIQNYRTQSTTSQIFLVAPCTAPLHVHFFHALAETEKMHNLGHRVIPVYPYLPYSRSDKKDLPGTTVVARLVADLIDASGAHSVAFARLHSPQVEGFFSIPTIHISGRETALETLRRLRADVIVSPDAGGQKEATILAKELGLPAIVFNKVRNPFTGAIELKEFSGISLWGKTAVIVDDEIETGGTQHEVAVALHRLGTRKRYALVTHMTGPANLALQSHYLDGLIHTNTLPVMPAPRKGMVSIIPELARALKPLTEGFNLKSKPTQGCSGAVLNPALKSESKGDLSH